MHHQSRRLTPHPAGLPTVVATLFVVLAAFIAAADPSSSTPSVAARTASPLRARLTRGVPPVPPAAAEQVPGGRARAAVSDTIGGDDDGCVEHGETRRIVSRSEKRSSSSTSAAQPVLDSPRPVSRGGDTVAPTLRGCVAPSPVVPRAPPAR